MAACPSGYTFIAPDMRGFGGSEPVAIDATRGLRDWSDDILALLDALDIDGSFHSLGWSTGGGALMQLLIDHPDRLSSLSLVGSVSPYGFGGTNRDGSPCTPDHAGTGGGAAAPDFMAQLRARNLGHADQLLVARVQHGRRPGGDARRRGAGLVTGRRRLSG
jgi:pimeloyl-ACP methyl ester carboxylesterase